MRQTPTPKRFLALALSAGILATGLTLSATTANAAVARTFWQLSGLLPCIDGSLRGTAA